MLTMQRTALLACLAVCRTVSTDALQVLAGAMPWDLEAIRVAIIYKVKRGLALTPSESIMSSIERKAALQEHFLNEWQTRWSNSVKGRATFKFLSDVRCVFSVPDFGFSRRLDFLLTGLGSLAEFLKKRTLRDDESCFCGEAVNVAH